VDHAALFAALPTAYLVMTPDLVIVDANPAYCAAVGRVREDIVGRPVFEAFPPTPDALDPATGVSRVQLSFEKARDTGRPDTMPIQKYDIPDPATGQFVERYWSLISVPVVDEDGKTTMILQRTQDVTDYVRERERGASAVERDEAWRRQVQEVEADLYARSQELRAALEDKQVASLRLASLAEVALQLSGAQTVDDLTTIVVDRGLRALGADGGAVAVRAGEVLRLTITASLGEGAQMEYAELPLDGVLPASVVATTGHRVVLRDGDEALGWHEDMQGVLTLTGCQSWACLPLQVGPQRLGSLSVGWAEPRELGPDELEVLDALAAQCAQALERIQSRQAERRSAASARRMSETLQRSLLTEPPQPESLQIAVRYLPAAQDAQVGGDWYDAFATADGATCVVIGDVAGHDRDAAAAMSQVRNVLRGVAYTLAEPPAPVLAALDRAMQDLDVGSLATAVLGKLERDGATGRRTVRWSNAGHPPPLLVEPDGAVRLLHTEPDLLLGLDPSTERSDHACEVLPGSTLLLYTDGLIERRGGTLDQGLGRLVEAAERHAGRDLEAFCDALLAELGDRGDDDIALLAVRVAPD
jgi:serine phosphatase RsbU (regulator of sigma subunit)